ncbi:MAG: heme-binding protein [Desulfobacterales bacterium]
MQPSFPPLIWVGHFYLLNLEPSRFIPIISQLGFSGTNGAIEKRGLKSIGEPVWARYDPPFMPWFLRRNEVLIPVER